MNHCCVIVAGGSHARFFTLEDAGVPELESGPRLVELRDLINPEHKAHEGTLWSSGKAGRNRAPGGGAAHGYDDHREQHGEEFERRFARDIAEEATRLVKSHNTQHVILVAQKRMLGLLRIALDPLLKAGVNVQEFATDLGKLPPQDLHAHLSRQHLLPPCRRHTAG